MKFESVMACAIIAVSPAIALAADLPSDANLLARAKEIHSRIITFDSHLDLPFDYAGASADGKTQFDLPKTARGQLKGAAIAVFVPQGPRTSEGYAKARVDAEKKLALIKAIAAENPGRAAIASSPADVRRISAQGKFAVVISMLNVYPLGSEIGQLDEWYKRGVRILGYTHAGNNDWADSSRPSKPLNDKPGEHGGLSELGKQGVARLNDLGMLIDVSQLTTLALKQVLAVTRAPVAATHSGIRAIVDAPRNLSDEELELIKKNGGVVQQLSPQSPGSVGGRCASCPGNGGTTRRFDFVCGKENRNRPCRHFVGLQSRWRSSRVAERRRGPERNRRASSAGLR